MHRNGNGSNGNSTTVNGKPPGFFFSFFLMLIFVLATISILTAPTTATEIINNTNTTNTSASPRVIAWRVRWHRDNSTGDSQQRLETQYVSSCWYVFCFFVLFITLIFILGSLKALKRGGQHQHQHQGLETRHVSSCL